MSDTPRTDALVKRLSALTPKADPLWTFARQLERELTARGEETILLMHQRDEALKAANGTGTIEANLAASWGRWHDYEFASIFRDILCRVLDKAERCTAQGKPLPKDEIDAMTARLVEATERLDALGRPVKPHRSAVNGVGRVPNSWKLVPVVPTPAMVEAVRMNDVDLVRDGFDGGIAKLYHAMIDAAPDAP